MWATFYRPQQPPLAPFLRWRRNPRRPIFFSNESVGRVLLLDLPVGVDSKLAVEEARRGSRIWLGLGGDLHRRNWMYELGGAGIGTCAAPGCNE